VLWGLQAPEATNCQTAGLATAARSCDHIATMPRVTGGDRCPTRINNLAVDQHQQGRNGLGRMGEDGSCKTTDLAVPGCGNASSGARPAARMTGSLVGARGLLVRWAVSAHAALAVIR
jgi:hypothetical protein